MFKYEFLTWNHHLRCQVTLNENLVWGTRPLTVRFKIHAHRCRLNSHHTATVSSRRRQWCERGQAQEIISTKWRHISRVIFQPNYQTSMSLSWVGWSVVSVTLSVCVCVCPRSKRKTAWAINTKLGTHILYCRKSASSDRKSKGERSG